MLSTSTEKPRRLLSVNPEEVRRTIDQGLEKLRDIPLFPSTAQEALRRAEQGDISLKQMARLIESDVALATSLLRLVNSPLYGWGRGVVVLESAVVRLGLKECHNLILAEGVRRLSQQAPPNYRRSCAKLWQHSFVVACLCRTLNRQLSADDSDAEFTAGLLHDLGRILLILLVPDVFELVDPVSFDEDENILEDEQNLLGTDHAAVGFRFAERNRLPDAILNCVRYHHSIRTAPRYRGLVALVATADHLANAMHRRQKLSEYDLGSNPGLQYLTRTWDTERRVQLTATLPGIIKDAAQALAASKLKA